MYRTAIFRAETGIKGAGELEERMNRFFGMNSKIQIITVTQSSARVGDGFTETIVTVIFTEPKE